MENAADRHSNAEKLAQMPSTSPLALVPWEAQRVFHPENQQRTLLGRRPYTLHSRAHAGAAYGQTLLGLLPIAPGQTSRGSELSTPSSASWSFRLHLTRLPRQKVEAEAFPKTDFVIAAELPDREGDKPAKRRFSKPGSLLSSLNIVYFHPKEKASWPSLPGHNLAHSSTTSP